MGEVSPLKQVLRWLRSHLNARVVVLIAVAAGLLVYVIGLMGSSGRLGQFWMVLTQTWWLILFLTFPYLAARALVWYQLMATMGIRARFRPFILSVATTHASLSLPGGAYVKNYILGSTMQLGESAVVRSLLATSMRGGLETVVALPVLLVLGVPGWPWAFWVFLGACFAWLGLGVLGWLLVKHWAARVAVRRPALLHLPKLANELVEAGRDLLKGRTLIVFLPTAIYLLIYTTEMYLIMRALRLTSIAFVDTLAICAFIILAVTLNPLPFELGVTELSGVASLLPFHVPPATGAVVMLSLRALATGFVAIVSLVVVFLLRGELARAERRTEDVNGVQMGKIPSW